jgi:hypothetical protein
MNIKEFFDYCAENRRSTDLGSAQVIKVSSKEQR